MIYMYIYLLSLFLFGICTITNNEWSLWYVLPTNIMFLVICVYVCLSIHNNDIIIIISFGDRWVGFSDRPTQSNLHIFSWYFNSEVNNWTFPLKMVNCHVNGMSQCVIFTICSWFVQIWRYCANLSSIHT